MFYTWTAVRWCRRPCQHKSSSSSQFLHTVLLFLVLCARKSTLLHSNGGFKGHFFLSCRNIHSLAFSSFGLQNISLWAFFILNILLGNILWHSLKFREERLGIVRFQVRYKYAKVKVDIRDEYDWNIPTSRISEELNLFPKTILYRYL